jgi:hypothetical protein
MTLSAFATAQVGGDPPRQPDATRLAELRLGANGFAFDPRSGQSFTLNPTGLAALECLSRGCSVEETGQHLAEHYPVSAAAAAEATSAFLRQLGRYLA